LWVGVHDCVIGVQPHESERHFSGAYLSHNCRLPPEDVKDQEYALISYSTFLQVLAGVCKRCVAFCEGLFLRRQWTSAEPNQTVERAKPERRGY
jgi:hypothetical protein